MHSSGVTYAFTGNLTLSSFCKLIMSILFCCCLSCALLDIPQTSLSDVPNKYIGAVDPFKKRNEECGEDESGRRMTKHFCYCCTFDPDSPPQKW